MILEKQITLDWIHWKIRIHGLRVISVVNKEMIKINKDRTGGFGANRILVGENYATSAWVPHVLYITQLKCLIY